RCLARPAGGTPRPGSASGSAGLPGRVARVARSGGPGQVGGVRSAGAGPQGRMGRRGRRPAAAREGTGMTATEELGSGIGAPGIGLPGDAAYQAATAVFNLAAPLAPAAAVTARSVAEVQAA